MELDIRVRNVVVSASLGVDINLDYVVRHVSGARHNNKRFRNVVVRPHTMDATVMLFRSGKLTCVGAPSYDVADRTIRYVLDMMRSVGMDIPIPVTTIQNVVATADLHTCMNIEAISQAVPQTIYEPEMFSGVIHRVMDPATVLLLFSSGKIVCVGAKSVQDAHRSIHSTCMMLDGLGVLA